MALHNSQTLRSPGNPPARKCRLWRSPKRAKIGIFQHLLGQLVEEAPCGLQIGGVEPFGEPVIDRLQECHGLNGAALMTQQAGETRRSAQLPRQRFLPARPIERLPEEVLSAVSVTAGVLCNSKSSPLRRSNSGVSQPTSDCSIPASSTASPSAMRPVWAKASASSHRPVKNRKLKLGAAISSRPVCSSRDPVSRSLPLSMTTL